MMNINLSLPIELVNLALQLIDVDVDNTHATIDVDDLKNDHLLAYYHKRAMLYWALRQARDEAQREAP